MSPDWTAIEADFARGLSLRVLAAKYGLSKSAIHKHCNPPRTLSVARVDSGQSGQPLVDSNVDSGQSGQPPSTEASVDIDTSTLAKQLIEQMALIAQTPLDLKEHNLFAQALSQYHKIILSSPSQQDLPKGTDWSIFSKEELDIIQPIFALAEERRRVELGEVSIPQLRKF